MHQCASKVAEVDPADVVLSAPFEEEEGDAGSGSERRPYSKQQRKQKS